MKRACDGELLACWAATGAGAEPDAGLLDHLETCEACAAERAAILEVRAAMVELPSRRVPRERVDAIRFRVVAAARQHAASRARREPAAPPRHRRRWPPLAAVAAAVALAAMLALFAWPRGKGPAGSVELVANATGDLLRPGPDETYRLLDGKARFDVRKLAPDETFRVLVGEDSVEVRGTRFEVIAAAGRIAAVSVSEGVVVLRVAEGWSREMVAGDSWERSPPTVADVGQGPRSAAEPEPAPAPATSAASPAASAATPASPLGSSAAPGANTTQARASSGAEASSAPANAAAAFDARFQLARAALQAGNAAAAAMSFDALAASPAVDAGRRSDALYWAAYAHARAGNAAESEMRARDVAGAQTPGWHADDAALLLGESLLQKGEREAARPWLEQAARSPREAVRARARAALSSAASPP